MIPGITASLPVAAPPPVPFFPVIADDNATFTDEGTATTGWTASGGTLGVTGSVLRLTKNVGSGTSGSALKSITLPGSNLDFFMYVKVQMSRTTTNHAGAFWLQDSGNTRQFVLWLNYSAVGGAYTQGTVSIQAYESGTLRTATVATGVNTETDDLEFGLEYDHKWSTMNCYQKQVDGTWDLKARVACTFHSYTDARMVTLSTAPTGTWMEFDYWMIARPNIMILSDSIGEGKTLYSPDRSLALSNYLSTWTRYAELYPSLRNTIVSNKSVGGQTSAQLLARVADVTGQSPRLVILHASTNDEVNGISLADRTTNIQDTIDAIVTASAECVLLNAMYGTSTYSGNTPSPDHRDYMLDWWDNYRTSLTDLYASLDIMQAIVSSGFMNSSLTQADGIHPTPSGHEDIGDFIEAQPYAP